MFTSEELFEIRSNWILPDGTIKVVAQEGHDDDLPEFFKSIKEAEDTCVKVSCAWGYYAPISEIYLPIRLTMHQAQKLIEINDSAKETGNKRKDLKINLWHNCLDWKEIQELT